MLFTSLQQVLLVKLVNKCKFTSILDYCEANYESVKEGMLDWFGMKIWKRPECLFINKTEQQKRET